MTDKPPYRVPTMTQIRRTRLSGYRLVSTFSGAGGSCLGFRWAGFKTVYASEFVPAAREVYRLNHRLDPDPRDIREVTGASIRERAGLGPDDEIDVLEGSPPCSSFSMAGKREAFWGDVKKYSDVEQRTDDLFKEYARLMAELRPRVFVAENVPGLLRGAARGFFAEIFEQLAEPGYLVRAKVLDAQWLGVPQVRQRVIFVGVRKDLGQQPRFPTPLPYRYSIRDALPWLDGLPRATRSMSDLEPAPTIQTHGNAFTHSEFVVVRKTARNRTTDFEVQSRRADAAARPASLDSPSPTILAVNSGWSDVAPGKLLSKEHRRRSIRKLEIRELKRLCGFPDDFELTGTYAQQWERLGRAVPPPMSYRIALEVRTTLDAALDRAGLAERASARSRDRVPRGGSPARSGPPTAEAASR